MKSLQQFLKENDLHIEVSSRGEKLADALGLPLYYCTIQESPGTYGTLLDAGRGQAAGDSPLEAIAALAAKISGLAIPVQRNERRDISGYLEVPILFSDGTEAFDYDDKPLPWDITILRQNP